MLRPGIGKKRLIVGLGGGADNALGIKVMRLLAGAEIYGGVLGQPFGQGRGRRLGRANDEKVRLANACLRAFAAFPGSRSWFS